MSAMKHTFPRLFFTNVPVKSHGPSMKSSIVTLGSKALSESVIFKKKSLEI